MSYDLNSVLDNQKALNKNTFQVTTFKAEDNSRTFQGKWNFLTALPFPQLCQACSLPSC